MLRSKTSFQIGDAVIYRQTWYGTTPSPRAQSVDPAPRGEFYAYRVEKHWRVVALEPDGRLVLRTRRGKLHRLAPDDRNLRRATLFERWRLRHRFPAPATLVLPLSGKASRLRARIRPLATGRLPALGLRQLDRIQ